MTHYTYLPSILGRLLLLESDGRLTGIYFADKPHSPKVQPDWILSPDHAIFRKTAAQLSEYVAGKRRTFDVPIAFKGTEFQQKVWAAIHAIPFGETTSYKTIAEQLGKPNASRAVGRATGLNPISWIVPCHRVVGSSASLTGYAGGLPRKSALLDFERARFSGESTALKRCE